MNLFKAAEGNGSQFTAACGADWQAALEPIPRRPLLSSPPRGCWGKAIGRENHGEAPAWQR